MLCFALSKRCRVAYRECSWLADSNHSERKMSSSLLCLLNVAVTYCKGKLGDLVLLPRHLIFSETGARSTHVAHPNHNRHPKQKCISQAVLNNSESNLAVEADTPPHKICVQSCVHNRYPIGATPDAAPRTTSVHELSAVCAIRRLLGVGSRACQSYAFAYAGSSPNHERGATASYRATTGP